MTAADEAIAQIRRRILSGSLRAGSKLQQEQLALELGMSRIPVRDAIRTLASEGLIRLQPRRTAVVAPVSQDDLAELYELRGAIEPLASAQALAHMGPSDFLRMRGFLRTMQETDDHLVWLQANDDFHACLFENSGRPRMIALLRQAREQTRRYTGIRMADGRADLDAEHRLILVAAERRDAQAVEALVRAHLISAFTVLRRELGDSDHAEVSSPAEAGEEEVAARTNRRAVE
ncbi:MAG TPA: GntR family transcriptional regulator [Acidimicrobiia bacterium]|nr:GntR family transcriptional regulator [Acidimicrobiia bacterium]